MGEQERKQIPATHGVGPSLGEVTTKMPASKHGKVQTDKYNDRKFITLRISSNGKAPYRKVYLPAKDHPTARRRARALEHLDDVEEPWKGVRYLAGSRTPEMERRRIAEVARLGPLIPTLDHAANVGAQPIDFARSPRGRASAQRQAASLQGGS